MELSLPHTLHLFNIFRENDGKENYAKVLEEEVNKLFGTKSSNDENMLILEKACWKYALEAIIKWLLLYFLVHDNCLLFML